MNAMFYAIETYQGTWNRPELKGHNPHTATTPDQPPAIDILTFASEVGFHPDPIQTRVLLAHNQNGILNCTRQWGKSSCAGVMALHHAFTIPNSLVVIISTCEKQAAELVRKCRRYASHRKLPTRGDGTHNSSLQLPNGSRILALPATDGTTRGYSAVGLLIIDEAARVDDAVYTAIRPALAVSGGKTWLLSTPDGQQGFFHRIFKQDGDSWKRFAVKAEDCPRIPKDYLADERLAMTEEEFQQEYCCAFTQKTGGYFSREMFERATIDFPAWCPQ